MPFLWVHKHREEKKAIEKQGSEDVVESTELDAEANTVIFASRHSLATRLQIFLVDLTSTRLALEPAGLWRA